jgi:hypothetical protein
MGGLLHDMHDMKDRLQHVDADCFFLRSTEHVSFKPLMFVGLQYWASEVGARVSMGNYGLVW